MPRKSDSSPRIRPVFRIQGHAGLELHDGGDSEDEDEISADSGGDLSGGGGAEGNDSVQVSDASSYEGAGLSGTGVLSAALLVLDDGAVGGVAGEGALSG